MPNRAHLARIVAAAALAAATLGVPAGAANAVTRDPCSDIRNKERADRVGGLTYDAQEDTWTFGDPLPPLPLSDPVVPVDYDGTLGDRTQC